MFSFIRKTYLVDLIPDGFCDIHNHIIPGIDDGSKNLENALALISEMQQLGIKHIIATPHVMENVWENSSKKILLQCNTLNEFLTKNKLPSVKSAAEYMLDENFKKLLKKDDLLAINNKYLLVELSYINAPLDLFETLFNIQVADYKPILAHPERYQYYHQTFEMYKNLKDTGCLFQLNMLSLTKHYGSDTQKTAYQLLKKGMYDFVGSDIHNLHHTQKIKEITIPKQLIEPLKKVVANNLIFSH